MGARISGHGILQGWVVRSRDGGAVQFECLNATGQNGVGRVRKPGIPEKCGRGDLAVAVTRQRVWRVGALAVYAGSCWHRDVSCVDSDGEIRPHAD